MDYKISWRLRVTRFFLKPIFRLLFLILADVKITGLENVPREGGSIIAINHISIFDPPFVISFWPVMPEVVGAVEIWSKRGQSTLVSAYGAIPIQRGGYSRQSLETMITALRSRHPLVIAPEGGRSHEPGLRRGQPGIGFLLEKVSVPVIPVGIVGTTEDFFTQAIRARRPRLEMRIGKPITIETCAGDPGQITKKATDNPVESRKAKRQQIADEIMIEIASLLPEKYRGVYTNFGVE